MDFLFSKDRTVWVYKDREATKVGAIFERDMAHGEALTVFNENNKTQEIAPQVDQIETREGDV
jgi:hypothetical protein